MSEIKKDIKPIVKNKPKMQKKGLFARLSSNLEELGKISVKEYVMDDIIIPKLLNLVSDTVSDVATTMADTVSDITDVALWGEKRSKKQKKNGSSTSYTAYYKGVKNDGERRERTNRGNNYDVDFSDLTFETRAEAEEVLDALKKCIKEYESVSVADLLRFCEYEHDFVDQKYGWTDLTNAYTSRGRNGYILKLPKARVLD